MRVARCNVLQCVVLETLQLLSDASQVSHESGLLHFSPLSLSLLFTLKLHAAANFTPKSIPFKITQHQCYAAGSGTTNIIYFQNHNSRVFSPKADFYAETSQHSSELKNVMMTEDLWHSAAPGKESSISSALSRCLPDKIEIDSTTPNDNANDNYVNNANNNSVQQYATHSTAPLGREERPIYHATLCARCGRSVSSLLFG